MTDTQPNPDSVLDSLVPAPYDAAAAADYERTQQLLTSVLALYSARRWDLEHPAPTSRTNPDDRETLSEVIVAQARTAELLQTLDPGDVSRVAQVHAACVAVLRGAAQP
jgi:hypothetical protein